MSLIFPLDETEMLHQPVQKVDIVPTEMPSERSSSPQDITDLDKVNRDDNNTMDYTYIEAMNELEKSPIPEPDVETTWDLQDMLNVDSLAASICSLCKMSFCNITEFEDHVKGHENGDFELSSSFGDSGEHFLVQNSGKQSLEQNSVKHYLEQNGGKHVPEQNTGKSYFGGKHSSKPKSGKQLFGGKHYSKHNNGKHLDQTDIKHLLEQISCKDFHQNNGKDYLVQNNDGHHLEQNSDVHHWEQNSDEYRSDKPYLELNSDEHSFEQNAYEHDLEQSSFEHNLEQHSEARLEQYSENNLEQNSYECDLEQNSGNQYLKQITIELYLEPNCSDNNLDSGGSFLEHSSTNVSDILVDPKMLENGNQVEDKSRSCNVCPQIFQSDEALKEHSKSHSSKGNYCDVCNVKFSSAHSLNRHKTKIHANQKTYECRLCCMKFLNIKILHSHRDSHIQKPLEDSKNSNKNAFTCEKCSKVYSRKSKLLEHMDMHSKNTKKCDYCHEELTYLAMKKHIKKNHVLETCQICGKTFIDKRLFLEHEKDHFVVSDNTCDYCQKMFDVPEILCLHMMEEHVGNSDEYKCNLCLKTFHSERHLKCHMSFSHVAVCHVCSKKFNRHSDLSSHMRQAHKPIKTVQPTNCRLCPAEFSSRSSLAAHLTNTHGFSNPYRCKLCKGGFRNVKKHRRDCTALRTGKSLDEDIAEINFSCDENNVFSCLFCNATYDNQSNLEKHMLSRHKGIAYDPDAKDYTCKSCEKTFLSIDELIIHLAVHSKEKLFACKLCTEAYRTQVNLTQHYKEAHLEKVHLCQYCNEVFDRKSSLKKHKLSEHSDVYKTTVYQCSLCSKELSSGFALKTHISSVHTDDRPFKCTICYKTFKTDQVLKRHLLAVHIGERAFVCDYCSESFKTNTVLEKHKYKKHKDKVPQSLIDKYDSQRVKCEICFKELSNKSQLMKHMRIHSKGKLEECCFCTQKFTAKYSLVRHMKNTHSDCEGYGELLQAQTALLEADACSFDSNSDETVRTVSDRDDGSETSLNSSNY